MTVVRPEVPDEIISKLRLICLDLPEVEEEKAWAGRRWVVRKKTFAHVLVIDAGWPPAYAKAAGSNGPLVVLTFRTAVPAAELRRFDRAPFFRPPWFPNIVGVSLDDALRDPQGRSRTDWYEIAELVTKSYCVLAPAKLAALVDQVQS